MNVQKLFDMLQEDLGSTALGIICAELEEQGYKVQIDSREVNSADIYDGRHKDLEDKLGPFNMALYKDGSLEQEFSLEFLDNREAVIERKIE
jgi:hypothetical protein